MATKKKKKVVKKVAKKTTKKVAKKKVSKKKVVKKKSLGIDDEISLGDFLNNEGNILLLAGDKEEIMNEEFGRILTFMFRQFTGGVEGVAKRLEKNIEIKAILKIN